MNDLANSHIMVEGQFVSAKIEQVVLAIKEYESDIEVKWIPPQVRTEGEAAFKIIYAPVGQVPFTLFHVAKDEDFDERVLMRIIANDQRNGAVTLSEYEAWEEAQKRVEHQKFLDELEEAHDIAAHVIRSPFNKYVVNDNLTIKDGIPFNANRLKD